MKMDTNYRDAIPLKKRIAVALYTLGSSAEIRTVANVFGIGRSTVGEILLEFCAAIWEKLKPEYMNAYPLTDAVIKRNIDGFQELGLPQCIGAIGKIRYTSDIYIFIYSLIHIFQMVPTLN